MNKQTLKLLIWAALLVVVAVVGVVTLKGAGRLIAYFQSGADPAAALNIVPNIPPDLHVRLDWLADDQDTGRIMEPYTRSQIEAAYLRAWLQWNISLARGEPYGLKTYFVGPALAALDDTLTVPAGREWRVNQSDTSHRLQLHFYSADGSIISFSDTANVTRQIRGTDGADVYVGETTSRYDVVMFLEDGNWRIRHLVQRGDHETPARVATPSGFVGLDGNRLGLNGHPFELTGVNYYPQARPWLDFWLRYDPPVSDTDLARIQSLGLNAVRIFVPYDAFGGPTVRPDLLDRLADFLDRATAHGLKAIVTLFDFRTDYNLLLWPQSDRHIESIVGRFRDHPAILAWDLKNEPDLDYAANGRQLVDAWLTHSAKQIRAIDPNHLITIGWSSPTAAANLSDLVDFVSFHYFTPAQDLPQRYSALRVAVGEKPIAMTEFGLSTWNSPFFPGGHSEPEQAQYYADILGALRGTDSAGYLAWTLYDFDSVPPSVVGRLPWRTGPQSQFGLIRRDGTPKAAAGLLAAGAPLDVVRIPPLARFLKPFWLALFISVLVVLFIAIRLRNSGRSR